MDMLSVVAFFPVENLPRGIRELAPLATDRFPYGDLEVLVGLFTPLLDPALFFPVDLLPGEGIARTLVTSLVTAADSVLFG